MSSITRSSNFKTHDQSCCFCIITYTPSLALFLSKYQASEIYKYFSIKSKVLLTFFRQDHAM